MTTPGQKLDLNFQMKVVRDGVAKVVTFAELLTRPTIVSIYMKNNTSSCDRQNESLAEHAAEFDRAGYDLIAISRDTCSSHERYASAKKISYTLASDPDDQFAKAADALVEKSMYGKKYIGPARSAYVLDRSGKVLAVVPKVDTADHAAQLRATLEGLPGQRSGFGK